MSELHRRTFVTLLFSVFATVVGVGIVVPLLPIYAHDLGASGLYIGLIFGAFALSRTLFVPYFGRLSDHNGRKRIILGGLLAYAIISVAYVFADSVPALIVIRFFHGIASAMLMPVLQAYVGDISPEGRHGRVMGIYSSFVLVGLGLGPLIGGVINDNFGLDAAFITMGGLALIGFATCFFLLPPANSEQAGAQRRAPVPWRTLLTDRTISALFLFRFGYVVCIGIVWGFLPLYADVEMGLSSASIGLLITLGILTSGSMNTPMGLLSDRIDKRLMIVVGGMLVATSMLLFGSAQSYVAMLVAAVLFGIGGGTCFPAHMAIATMKGGSNDSMGSVMALLTVAHSVGMLSGALLGGVLMDSFQLRFVFPVGATIMALAVVSFLGMVHAPKRLLDATASRR